jgi:hypothetical protein
MNEGAAGAPGLVLVTRMRQDAGTVSWRHPGRAEDVSAKARPQVRAGWRAGRRPAP